MAEKKSGEAKPKKQYVFSVSIEPIVYEPDAGGNLSRPVADRIRAYIKPATYGQIQGALLSAGGMSERYARAIFIAQVPKIENLVIDDGSGPRELTPEEAWDCANPTVSLIVGQIWRKAQNMEDVDSKNS